MNNRVFHIPHNIQQIGMHTNFAQKVDFGWSVKPQGGRKTKMRSEIINHLNQLAIGAAVLRL